MQPSCHAALMPYNPRNSAALVSLQPSRPIKPSCPMQAALVSYVALVLYVALVSHIALLSPSYASGLPVPVVLV